MDSVVNKKRVALGMSGGVDSSLCAHLLLEAGYEVTGVYLECWRAPGCRTEEDRKDALAVALSVNIPFQVLDFKQAYKDRVVEYFFTEYEAGRTPNPDVMCNKEIKFGLFYDWAMENGFDFVATGHYAQVNKNLDTNRFELRSSEDAHKDQTYFLYRLAESQLEHIIFPVGHLEKTQVREEAKKRNIPVADKKDSVGICFIGDINVHEFLFERLGENPGDVVDTKGNVIGKHKGLWFYTVGQRHGFTIFPKIVVTDSSGNQTDKHNIPPFYVISKNAEKNQLVVGFGAETYMDQFALADVHWISDTQPENDSLFVRIRHTGKLISCTLKKENQKVVVILDQPTQGIAEGQSAVFYQQDLHDTAKYSCLGGGVIVALY